jgi:hypothetical protein
VSIASAGSYAKPTTLTISGDLKYGTIIETDGNAYRGVGLGYFSSAPNGPGAYHPFSGLTLHSDGHLALVVDGADSGEGADYTGTFDVAAYHPLSYNIDMTTGAISNIVLDGQSKSMTTTAFTNARTAYAGFSVSSYDVPADGMAYGCVDNFSLTTVPEPSTIVVLTTGLLGLLAYAWRKHG